MNQRSSMIAAEKRKLSSAQMPVWLAPEPIVSPIRVLGIALRGPDTGEEIRLRGLLRDFDADILPFDREAKVRMLFKILRTIRSQDYSMVVLEGTGLAGGLAVILGRMTAGVPYIVSSGDAVAPFLARRWPWSFPLATVYERALCRLSAGVIGWTPYLVGRALTLGARRAMTIAGWAPFPRTREELATARNKIRSKLGIPRDSIVFGIVGSLIWNNSVKYSYGLDLVEAIQKLNRDDVIVLVVGDGTGTQRLREVAGARLGKTVIMPGRVPQAAVMDYLAAMDVATLPQSVDGVGSFRYTTKLSEYVSVGLPVVTGQIPLAYDCPDDWLWRLPGDAPWSEQYVDALAGLMETITWDEIAKKRSRVCRLGYLFDEQEQVSRATKFITELCEWSRSRRGRRASLNRRGDQCSLSETRSS
jgi:hypothetical protein